MIFGAGGSMDLVWGIDLIFLLSLYKNSFKVRFIPAGNEGFDFLNLFLTFEIDIVISVETHNFLQGF